MTNGLWKGRLLVLIISLYWNKRFSREHPKNPNANVWARPDVKNPNANVPARPDVTFWAVGYHPPRVPASFSHVLCKIWEHTYVQKD